ncbi:hypothetical protein [Catellatospora chokoriensis]|uniref:Phage protein D n=1 Tax=Catellatospora chokoriensis TaxID=310353 RepID=A0A8J3K502_9ACTN|nr:hypothetical protein [Catellatospora chokoriensis]GIF90378.1 hypothetical protein Cch02nite_38220 [Catellatospora chokoriensis]
MPGGGLHLSVLAGSTIPVPLPAPMAARLRSVTVTESDKDRSLFSMTFDAGRSGPAAVMDTALLTASPVAAFARVVLVVKFGALPRVLMDGIITQVELAPGRQPGSATLTALGEDVTYLLDRVEADAEHACLSDFLMVQKILLQYSGHRLVPMVIPTPVSDPVLPVEYVPTQHDTDLGHLRQLAELHGYVCYAIPGPAPGQSVIYWGPPVRQGPPQRALSVDLGPHSNVTEVNFRLEALGPVLLDGEVLDERSGQQLPVRTAASLRPPLSVLPLWATRQGDLRRRRFRDSGVTITTAYARAQARVDAASDAVIAEGALDGARYADVLRPRGLVGVRGAGWSHDGLWYVRQVTHELSRGAYQQRFTLSRDGYGSTVPVVVT